MDADTGARFLAATNALIILLICHYLFASGTSITTGF
jgi:hypothetical protein